MKIEDVFGHLPELQSERLLLRKVRDDDLQDMYAYTSDPNVTKHTSWNHHTSIDATRQWIQYLRKQYEQQQVADWGIVHNDTGKLIGTCGFSYWSIEHAKAGVGYVINPAYWGQGLMTEVLHAVLAFGFHTMQLNRIEATCKPENIGSWRVLEKAGMQLEGTHRQWVRLRGELIDIRMYAILRREYTA